MTTVHLKKNIHEAVDKIDDPGLLQAVYTILEKQMKAVPEYELTLAQQKELDKRLAGHKAGRSRSYTWAEAKKSLSGKQL